MLADGLCTSSQGSRLVGSESYGSCAIGKKCQRGTALHRLGIMTNLDLSLIIGLGEYLSRGVRHPLTHLTFFKMRREGDAP